MQEFNNYSIVEATDVAKYAFQNSKRTYGRVDSLSWSFLCYVFVKQLQLNDNINNDNPLLFALDVHTVKWLGKA